MRQAWVFSIAVLVTALSCALAPAAYAQGTTFTVTTTADHDDGSCTVSDCTLREAINAANANAGADAIAFGLTGGAPYVIRIESLNGGTESLPAITDPVTIDGTTEPGYVSGPPLVEIQSPVGAPVDSAGYGLVVEASNVTIRGLAIDGFFADITLDGRSCGGCGATSMHDDSLEDDYVGLDAAGGVAPALGGVTRAADSGWSQWGVQDRFANGTRIVNSHLGGIDGVVISVEQSNDTVIQGDTIGTDPSGSTAVPGASSTGIGVFGSSSNTQIGGANASPAGSCSGECNVIVATGIAVSVAGSGDGAQIQGNFIGVDASGATALCDCSGIATQVGNTTIGGTTPALRNVIGGTCRDSASSGDLVVLDGLENNGGDVVEGNYIGTDVSGTRALSPSGDCNGIATADNPVNAVIGGSTGVTAGFGRCTGACNLVSGALDGISVFGQGIRVEGNFVGTDVTGTRPIPNENGIIGGHGDGAGGDSIGGL